MSITIKGITAEELAGSGNITVSGGKYTGKRIFKIAWEDQKDFTEALQGSVSTDVDGNQVTILPQTFPNYEFLYCTNIDIRGQGAITKDGDNYPIYTFAKVTATYEQTNADPFNPIFRQNPSENVKETLETTYGAEVLTFDSKKAKWYETEKKASNDVSVFKTFSTLNHTYTRELAPSIPRSTLKSLAGRVNDAPFEGADTGTLLFLGATTRGGISAEGKKVYTITYKFKEHTEATWNEFYDIDTKAWDYLIVNSVVFRPHPLADFTDIFGETT